MPPRRLRPIDSRVSLIVDGAELEAQRGEPIAISLWAAGRLVLGRSVKYHRPRGAACLSGGCDGCVMRVGGAPSVRTCRTPARHGTTVDTQNVMGTAELDLLAATDFVFPEGMNHHEMFTWSRPINRAMQEIARHVAGVGTLPDEPRAPAPVERLAVDVCVVGAGPAGRACAEALVRAGVSVVAVDEEDAAGTASFPLRARTSAIGVFDETNGARWVLASGDAGVIVIVPKVLVLATGRAEGSEAFAGNDLPGVIALEAAERLFAAGVLPGERPVIAGASEGAEALVQRFAEARVSARLVPRESVIRARGRSSIRLVDLREGGATPCDVLVVEGRRSARYELASQAGAEVRFDGEVFDVVTTGEAGETRHPRVFVAGSAARAVGSAAHGARVAARVQEVLGG